MSDHRKIWAMARLESDVDSEATVLWLLRDEGLILPARYQCERRKLAERHRAAFANDSGGTWRLAGRWNHRSKYEHPFQVSPTANQLDAVDAIELVLTDYATIFDHPVLANAGSGH